MTTYKIPKSHCPKCGCELDQATSADRRDMMPEQGDYSVCFECYAYLIYEDDLSLRLATPLEIEADDIHDDLFKTKIKLRMGKAQLKGEEN